MKILALEHQIIWELNCNTQFAYILNPDVTFQKDTFDNLSKSCLDISDFAIISPLHGDKNYPNYKIRNN